MATYTCLAGQALKPWYSVEITDPDETDSKHVLFHSTIHKNMPVKLTFCFARSYTDQQILYDRSVVTKFIQHFGADTFV